MPPKVRELIAELERAGFSDRGGSSPGLIYGGCHGSDENAVFDELCHVVEEAIAIYHKDGRPPPPATSGKDFANKMQNVA
jgi:hypothetical protein